MAGRDAQRLRRYGGQLAGMQLIFIGGFLDGRRRQGEANQKTGAEGAGAVPVPGTGGNRAFVHVRVPNHKQFLYCVQQLQPEAAGQRLLHRVREFQQNLQGRRHVHGRAQHSYLC